MKERTLTVKTVKTVDVNDIEYELWSGALDRWKDATDDTRAAVFDRVCDYLGYEEEADMTAVNDLIWFDCDDLFFPEEDDSDSENDTDDEDGDDEDDDTDNINADEDDMSKLYIDRYGIHAGRITCDGCHSVFKGNPFVDDSGSEYCSKECAEANGATGVHEDIAECMWCHYHSYGDWWSDNDGNVFCSRECAIRYNLAQDETAEENDDTDDEEEETDND